MDYDGKVIIGTGLDTKELEKQLKQEQRELEKYEKEAEKLTNTKAKLEMDIEPFRKAKEEAQNEIAELEGDLSKAQKNLKELQSEIGTQAFQDMPFQERQDIFGDIHGYEGQIEEINTRINELNASIDQTPPKIQKEIDKLDEVNKKIEENTTNQQLMKNKVQETTAELNKSKGLDQLKGSIQSASDGIGGIIKKVAKWSLAIIGIRSVYLGIRQAMSTILSYDKQMGTDIEYLKYALANTLKPVIEWIINAFYQILALFGYIVKQISGKNIFEKSGASQFKKDMAGASKSAKELKKQLAGFDEANVLSDTSSAGAGGGAGTPSKDLAKMVDEMSQEDVDKIWKEVDKGIKGARASLLDYQDELHDVLNNRQAFTDAYGVWDWFVHGIGDIWAGIVDVVSGVWDTLVGLWNVFMDIITGNFDKLGEDVSLLFTGLMEILGGIGEFVIGVAETTWGFVKGVLGTIFGWVYDNVIKPIWDWMQNLGKSIGDWFVGAWNTIKGAWNGAIDWFKSIGTGISNAFKTAVDKVGGFFTGLWNGIKNGIKNVANFVGGIANALKNGVKGVINFFIDGINKFIDGMNKIQWDVPDWVPFIGGQKWGINIPRVPRLAQGGIVNMPGSGVMMGNAIVGESGREGVLPLTDPNAMAQLGKEIGQWVNFAIDNKLVVDGRVLATATNDRINKESFLMNR